MYIEKNFFINERMLNNVKKKYLFCLFSRIVIVCRFV